MNDNDSNIPNNSRKFPCLIRVTSSVFRLLSEVKLTLLLSILLLSSFYIIDCYNGKALLFEKSAGLVTILGLLLTIKHGYLKNTESPLNYIHNINEVGSFSSTEFKTDSKYYEEAKKVAYDETIGFILTILGTLLNCFGGFLPLISFNF